MFENMTYENILESLLARVPDEYEKREGSSMWYALAPAALELAIAYQQLESILQIGFTQTNYGEYLDMRGEEHGVLRKPATKTTGEVVVVGTDGVVIPTSSTFSTKDGLQFVSTEEATITGGTATVKIEATEGGTKFNVPVGAITEPPPLVMGITSVENKATTTGGTDTEGDDEYRTRILETVRFTATSGNEAHYRMWVKSVAGIKDAKVFPLHAGPGTVKVTLLASDGRAPTTEKVQEVASYIEQEKPIGADVTCSPATEVPINVTANVSLKEGAVLETVQQNYINALTQIFSSVAFMTDTVRYSRVTALLLEIDGVLDWQNLTVNGGTANIELGAEGIPVVGTVTLNAI